MCCHNRFLRDLLKRLGNRLFILLYITYICAEMIIKQLLFYLQCTCVMTLQSFNSLAKIICKPVEEVFSCYPSTQMY